MTSFKEISMTCPTNRAAWRFIRKMLRMGEAKGDSIALFNAAIRDMQRHLDATGSIDNLEGLYYSIVSEKVNNPRSRFYLYG